MIDRSMPTMVEPNAALTASHINEHSIKIHNVVQTYVETIKSSHLVANASTAHLVNR